ncbi:Uncharacterised protein [Mycobacteroides abscessus subsp. abscessus]|nr:Uncharacterised protein [Mycobacteroides abscessus subsp. abscessus]SKU91923.1 Uncharacterised protein [Mycobacteroides abscessus subsp. abscessus]
MVSENPLGSGVLARSTSNPASFTASSHAAVLERGLRCLEIFSAPSVPSSLSVAPSTASMRLK